MDDRNPWLRKSRKEVYGNPWISVFHDEVIQPDGQPGIYGVVHFKNRAVGVVALDEKGQVLLVGQHRYPLDLYSWEIPEGGAPESEEPLEAAKRELSEETGFTASHWEPLLTSHLSNSVSDEVAYCYLATGLTSGTAAPEGTEKLNLRWVDFEEALRMVEKGEITDALSVMGLLKVALMRSFRT